MKKTILLMAGILLSSIIFAQKKLWTEQQAYSLSLMPLKCIQQEYPNKTAHIIMDEEDAQLTPSKLHPSFYGCFDWHSSVHGHWMLIKILKEYPDIQNRDSIIAILDDSFNPESLIQEAEYFQKYTLSKTFERTYGWAWLLKLDEELHTWDSDVAKKWEMNLKPLTDMIMRLWTEYLPKQTYPNNTGVHPNSAFGLAFAWDWAEAKGEKEFRKNVENKIRTFYLNHTNYPAYLEPDGSDFFSNSLFIADAMTRILDQKEFSKWLESFLSPKDFSHLSQAPEISDRMDYQITHLDGLMFSRAWNLKNIAIHLGSKNPHYSTFMNNADILIREALHNIDQGNYGGEHWLASFAVYALTRQ